MNAFIQYGRSVFGAQTGSMMQDNGATIMPTIGVVAIWILGAIILRIVGGIPSPKSAS
jgi:hypothetical protein